MQVLLEPMSIAKGGVTDQYCTFGSGVDWGKDNPMLNKQGLFLLIQSYLLSNSMFQEP